MILSTFASYVACKNELDEIEAKRNEYFESIPGVGLMGISYEEHISSSSKNNLTATISDKMSKWNEKHKKIENYCYSVINLCDEWLNSMSRENRKLFTLRYIEGKTLLETSKLAGFELSWTSRIIRLEAERIRKRAN